MTSTRHGEGGRGVQLHSKTRGEQTTKKKNGQWPLLEPRQCLPTGLNILRTRSSQKNRSHQPAERTHLRVSWHTCTVDSQKAKTVSPRHGEAQPLHGYLRALISPQTSKEDSGKDGDGDADNEENDNGDKAIQHSTVRHENGAATFGSYASVHLES